MSSYHTPWRQTSTENFCSEYTKKQNRNLCKNQFEMLEKCIKIIFSSVSAMVSIVPVSWIDFPPNYELKQNNGFSGYKFILISKLNICFNLCEPNYLETTTFLFSILHLFWHLYFLGPFQNSKQAPLFLHQGCHVLIPLTSIVMSQST